MAYLKEDNSAATIERLDAEKVELMMELENAQIKMKNLEDLLKNSADDLEDSAKRLREMEGKFEQTTHDLEEAYMKISEMEETHEEQLSQLKMATAADNKMAATADNLGTDQECLQQELKQAKKELKELHDKWAEFVKFCTLVSSII